MNLAGSRMDTEVRTFPTALDLFIMFEWQIQRSDCGGCGTRTRFPVSGRNPRCAVSSAIRRRGSLLCPALKKTLCGCCGRAHYGWYDRRVRQVRDLSCGDARIYLELAVRRGGWRHAG